MQVLSSAATIGLVVSVAYFVWRLFVLMKRRLLWRVRRKLILSYIFIGVVPSLLIVIFFLLGGVLIFMNVSAYLFKDGYDAIVDDVRLSAQAAASEISRAPDVGGRDDRARPAQRVRCRTRRCRSPTSRSRPGRAAGARGCGPVAAHAGARRRCPPG